MDKSRRNAFLDFNDKELLVVALRTNGVKPAEIARRMNAKLDTTHWRLRDAMRKAGVDDIALLVRWAMHWGFDEVLEPDTESVSLARMRRPGKKPIKWHRLPRITPIENARVATIRKQQALLMRRVNLS